MTRKCPECGSTSLIKTNIGDYECIDCDSVFFPSQTIIAKEI